MPTLKRMKVARFDRYFDATINSISFAKLKVVPDLVLAGALNKSLISRSDKPLV